MNLLSKFQVLTGKHVKEGEKIVERKYRFTGDPKTVIITDEYFTLHQIVAVRTFMKADGVIVNKGTKGGWLSSEECLSHEGSCWVDEESDVIDSRVTGHARVEKSQLYGKSEVRWESSVINSKLDYGSIVTGVSTVSGTTMRDSYISGNVIVYNSELLHVKIHGDAIIFDSHLRAITIDYSKKTIDAEPLSMARVSVMCKQHEYITQTIRDHCKWDDVKISADLLVAHAPSILKSVTGEGISLVIEKTLRLENVELSAKTDIVCDGGYNEVMGDDFLNPIQIDGKVRLSGYNILSGQISISGVWRLIDTLMKDDSVLKSDTNTEVELKNGFLDSWASIIVENNALLGGKIKIQDAHLTDDNCYTLDSWTYA